MGERRPVEMVRLEEPEQVYEVEAVFGRDAMSVFPNMNKDDDPMEALKASIGAKRFVSESELEEMKKARGLTVEDGTAAPDRPLAEVLAERKKAKQDAFDDQWRQMKTGKNRPLEPDELEFLETLAQREAEEDRRVRLQEAAELEAYRQAVAAAAEAKAAAAAEADGGVGNGLGLDLFEPGSRPQGGDEAAAAAGPGPGSTGGPGGSSSGGLQKQGAAAAARRAAGSSSKPLLPVLKPVVKVKPKGAAAAAAAVGGAAGSAAADQSSSRDSKRPRLQEGTNGAVVRQQQQQQEEDQPLPAAGLEGLLGGYASDSE